MPSQIEISGHSLEISAPLDAGTGRSTGKYILKPIAILKPSGASSPQFFQALITNETLKTVKLEFFGTDPVRGDEILLYTVTLDNARIAGYKQFSSTVVGQQTNTAKNNTLIDEVTIQYDKISVLHNPSGTRAEADPAKK